MLIAVLRCFVNSFAICLCVHHFLIYQYSPTIIRLCFMLFNDAFTVIILCTFCWWIMLTFTSVSTKPMSISSFILLPSLHHTTIIKVLNCRCRIFLRLFVLTLNIPRGVLWWPQRVIFCDPAITISTNLLLIFVCVPHQLEINIT